MRKEIRFMDSRLFGNSGKPIPQQTSAVADAILVCSHDFRHGEPKVCNRCAFGMFDMLVSGEGASSESGHDGW